MILGSFGGGPVADRCRGLKPQKTVYREGVQVGCRPNLPAFGFLGGRRLAGVRWV